MAPDRLKNESGYSMVELLVAILILTIAIIPMVSMFDSGLRSASTSGNYDKARAFANTKLEEAKNLLYETVRTDFPSEASSGKGPPDSDGEITSSPVSVPANVGLSSGSTYTVEKQYIEQPDEDPGPSVAFTESESETDTKLIRVTVTVYWGDNEYSATGLVSE